MRLIHLHSPPNLDLQFVLPSVADSEVADGDFRYDKDAQIRLVNGLNRMLELTKPAYMPQLRNLLQCTQIVLWRSEMWHNQWQESLDFVFYSRNYHEYAIRRDNGSFYRPWTPRNPPVASFLIPDRGPAVHMQPKATFGRIWESRAIRQNLLRWLTRRELRKVENAFEKRPLRA
jgi:hypothetical protein